MYCNYYNLAIRAGEIEKTSLTTVFGCNLIAALNKVKLCCFLMKELFLFCEVESSNVFVYSVTLSIPFLYFLVLTRFVQQSS